MSGRLLFLVGHESPKETNHQPSSSESGGHPTTLILSLPTKVSLVLKKEKQSIAKQNCAMCTPQFGTDYDKPLLPVTCEATPCEIFGKVAHFNNFIEEIVIRKQNSTVSRKATFFILKLKK